MLKSEIRIILKSEWSIVRIDRVQISDIWTSSNDFRVRILAFITNNYECRNPTIWHARSLNRTSEIRTKSFGFRHYISSNQFWYWTIVACLKSECSVFRQCRKPNDQSFKLAVFGFRTFGPEPYRSDFGQARLDLFIYKKFMTPFIYIKRSSLVVFRNPNVRTVMFLAFGRKFAYKSRTDSSVFRRFGRSNQIWYRTESLCPKSEHVRISDVDCTFF